MVVYQSEHSLTRSILPFALAQIRVMGLEEELAVFHSVDAWTSRIVAVAMDESLAINVKILKHFDLLYSDTQRMSVAKDWELLLTNIHRSLL